ncbi:MAG: hypothetical protein Q8L20_10980 [Gammaproteobacteria bacterium]|nr:hypothetical protein [Gammaproteobacteria bacterium]
MNALQSRILDVPAPAQVWTYTDLTETAEKQIERLLEIAAEKQRQGDPLLAKIYQDFAQGAFVLWKTLTKGRFDDVDHDRIERMLARKVMP